MSDDAKVAILALVVAIGFGLYNAIQTWRANVSQRRTADLAKRTADRVEWHDLLQTRHEILRTALASQGLLVRQQTAFGDVRFRAGQMQAQPRTSAWSADERSILQEVIQDADTYVAGLKATIAEFAKMANDAATFIPLTLPTPELRQAAYEKLEDVKTQQVKMQTDQATYDDWTVKTDRVLTLLQTGVFGADSSV
jgi:hypothetical protein